MEIELPEGESLVLKADLMWEKKFALTDRRIMILDHKGLFRKTWFQESEIPLSEIAEAYAEVTWAGTSALKVRLKNGAVIDTIQFARNSDVYSAVLGTFVSRNMQQKAVTDRCVNAINDLIK